MDDEDPWRGFCSIIERVSVLNVRNKTLVVAFIAVHPDVNVFAEHRRLMLRMVPDLARRAQDGGGRRQDFVIDDFAIVVLAGHGLSVGPIAEREAAARRFAALVIDGLRAPAELRATAEWPYAPAGRAGSRTSGRRMPPRIAYPPAPAMLVASFAP